MKKIILFLLISALSIGSHAATKPRHNKPKTRIFVLAENGGGHALFDDAARLWLNKLAEEKGFIIDYASDTKKINKQFLKQYQLFIQLDYPPYPWEKEAQEAFEDYIVNGKGGWIGFHHPTLLGVFDNYPMWQWYSDFMGKIEFKRHIPGGTFAMLNLEDRKHPVLKGLPASFTTRDEWYIYNKSPRPNVHVLASIDESTYNPGKDVKMGDHPVIWSNEQVKAKNIYIAMGHFPELLEDKNFTTLFRNSILWTLKH
ncbi:ThuA domain-containing protein [Pedobacter sp. UBA5917]|jgi:type 1 glutamine amidotransferase|uniref:ThuA domain-containing protein n=1 Tax=Pedobacter sp. UBA5917 TaxID=1947061 RepID=UPI0025D8C0FD|nr:ThuA domain-containing protein [Pedobacter sp. UBA5917]